MRTQFRGVTASVMDELTRSVLVVATGEQFAGVRRYLSSHGFNPVRVVIVGNFPEQDCDVVSLVVDKHLVRFDLARNGEVVSDPEIHTVKKFVVDTSQSRSFRSRVRAAESILDALVA